MLQAIEFALPLAGGLLAGLLALALVLRFAPRERAPLGLPMGEVLAEPREFRFRNGYLVEHSDNVAFLLPEPIDRLRAWDELERYCRT